MKKRKQSLISLLMLLQAATAILTAQQPALRTLYKQPAQNWESQALPLGNGYMGCMVFGGVEKDLIQVNEKTVWSGGPGKNPNYDGGHNPDILDTQKKENLQMARRLLQEKMTDFSENKAAYRDNDGKVVSHNYDPESPELKKAIQGLMGEKTDFGSYQTLGNIVIGDLHTIKPDVKQIESNCDRPNNPDEGVKSLFDDNHDTKWFAGDGAGNFPCIITWNYDKPYAANAYQFVSANDDQGRHPKEWKLYASNNGRTFKLLDHQTNQSYPGSRKTTCYPFPGEAAYKYFKIEILATTGGANPQLAEISLRQNNPTKNTPQYTGYARTLDLDKALATVTFKNNGVTYNREYFMSYPRNVMAIKYTADKKGALTKAIWLESPQPKVNISANGNTITLTGYTSDQTEKGLRLAQQIQVVSQGGRIKTENNKIIVENADQFTVLMSAATNYVMCIDDSFNYFSPADPLANVKSNLKAASSIPYDKLLAEHCADYGALFHAMQLNPGNIPSAADKPTDELLAGYKKGTNATWENRYLELLYFQFGRYLLIASSREKTLPANLQGIWAQGLSNPWNSDYHTNINLQMNYWLAEQTNLSSCHMPVIDYIKSLVPRGRITAKRHYTTPGGKEVRGWVIHHENNVWGNTAPGNWYTAFYFPTAAAWCCQDIWEHYRFTADTQFLKDNYDILLDAALFWIDNLWVDSRDGKLGTNPAYSPEHGDYSIGTSADQAIITELFDFVIKASEILQKPSKEIDEIKAAKKNLLGPQIGLDGQFMEWRDEITLDLTGDNHHRHVNHLFWLHPGSQIIAGRSENDNRFVKAMKKTLNTRGDGGTGWSKAWKINFWARLHEGNRAHKLLGELLKESTLQNLFDTHPPFQIDGNFGATAGIAEMLVQSQGENIVIFPALPDEWASGSVKGIKARGNFEIDMDWVDSKPKKIEVTSLAGSRCAIKYAGIGNAVIKEKGRDDVPAQKINADEISFQTQKGKLYQVIFH